MTTRICRRFQGSWFEVHTGYQVLAVVLFSLLSGCRVLSVLPHNYVCPYPHAVASGHVAGMPATQLPPTSPPVQVEQLAVEQAPTLIDAVLTARTEIEQLKQRNEDSARQLEAMRRQMERGTAVNQQVSERMVGIRDNLAAIQGELTAWRSDLAKLQGRVRDQHLQHERTLADVERQLHEMLSLYQEPESPSVQ